MGAIIAHGVSVTPATAQSAQVCAPTVWSLRRYRRCRRWKGHAGGSGKTGKDVTITTMPQVALYRFRPSRARSEEVKKRGVSASQSVVGAGIGVISGRATLMHAVPSGVPVRPPEWDSTYYRTPRVMTMVSLFLSCIYS